MRTSHIKICLFIVVLMGTHNHGLCQSISYPNLFDYSSVIGNNFVRTHKLDDPYYVNLYRSIFHTDPPEKSDPRSTETSLITGAAPYNYCHEAKHSWDKQMNKLFYLVCGQKVENNKIVGSIKAQEYDAVGVGNAALYFLRTNMQLTPSETAKTTYGTTNICNSNQTINESTFQVDPSNIQSGGSQSGDDLCSDSQ